MFLDLCCLVFGMLLGFALFGAIATISLTVCEFVL